MSFSLVPRTRQNVIGKSKYLIMLAFCMESIFVYLHTILKNDLFNSRLCHGLVFWHVLLLHTAAIMICMVLLWSTQCKIFSTCHFKFVLCRSIFCCFIIDNGNETHLKLAASIIDTFLEEVKKVLIWYQWYDCIDTTRVAIADTPNWYQLLFFAGNPEMIPHCAKNAEW